MDRRFPIYQPIFGLVFSNRNVTICVHRTVRTRSTNLFIKTDFEFKNQIKLELADFRPYFLEGFTEWMSQPNILMWLKNTKNYWELDPVIIPVTLRGVQLLYNTTQYITLYKYLLEHKYLYLKLWQFCFWVSFRRIVWK